MKTCSEEATEMATKYLHNKKCVFNNFGKYSHIITLTALKKIYIYIYIYMYVFTYIHIYIYNIYTYNV